MGLLDDIVGSLTGGQGQKNSLGQLQAIWSWIQEQGGIEVLIQKFHQGGLGEILTSWLSNGSNKTVSGGEIQSAFGQQNLQSLADKLGTDIPGASAALAEVLPQLVDKISPQGEVQDEATAKVHNDLGSMVDSIFRR